MTVIEIIFAILLILSCVFIIAVVLMQESKQGMSNVITGGSTDNYFQKNSGRTKEAKLARATKVAAIMVFVLAVAVNLITVYFGGSAADSAAGQVADNLSSVEEEVADDTEDDESADDTADTEEEDSDTAETEATETSVADTSAAETEATAG